MWNLYLDESGDLGFDFVNKKPSKFFTISILAVSSRSAEKDIERAVKKTIRRKLNPKNKRKRYIQELKATKTNLQIKKYFFDQIEETKFGIYSITLNKQRAYERLTNNKSKTYNWIARQVIDQIPFEKADSVVNLIVDKSKGKPEIEDFNRYIENQLAGRLDPCVQLNIYHNDSQNSLGLQAIDLFTWGIFQKYERKNENWLNIYKNKILFDSLYFPEK